MAAASEATSAPPPAAISPLPLPLPRSAYPATAGLAGDAGGDAVLPLKLAPTPSIPAPGNPPAAGFPRDPCPTLLGEAGPRELAGLAPPPATPAAPAMDPRMAAGLPSPPMPPRGPLSAGQKASLPKAGDPRSGWCWLKGLRWVTVSARYMGTGAGGTCCCCCCCPLKGLSWVMVSTLDSSDARLLGLMAEAGGTAGEAGEAGEAKPAVGGAMEAGGGKLAGPPKGEAPPPSSTSEASEAGPAG